MLTPLYLCYNPNLYTVKCEIVIESAMRKDVLKNGTYKEFVALMTKHKDGTVSLLEFRGHGSMIDDAGVHIAPFVGPEGSGLLAYRGEIVPFVIESDVPLTGFQKLLRQKMKAQGTVWLKGCNTAKGVGSLAETLSRNLPCVHVKGYGFWSVSFIQFYLPLELQSLDNWSPVVRSYFNGELE